MHSRIFGIVPLDEYVEGMNMSLEWEFNFADYTRISNNIGEDMLWLKEFLMVGDRENFVHFNEAERTISFDYGFKKEYFKEKWQLLMKMISYEENAFDKFCGEINDFMFLHMLKKNIEEEFGFYVCDDYGSWETLDEFVRHIEYGRVYKIFGSLDYHW